MIAPIYNVDGTDTYVTQDGGLGSETPHILGVRENSQGLDLNRDVEGNGLYRTLNDWDPLLFLDGHLMSRVDHGYANTYGTTTVPAGLVPGGHGTADGERGVLLPGASGARRLCGMGRDG